MSTSKNFSDELENLVSCFLDLTPQELEIINKNKTRVEYLAGETIFKQDAFSSHVLLIVGGLVRTYLQTGSDKQLNLFLHREGDFLAFSTIFGEDKYSYSAVAVGNASLCMIDKEIMQEVLLRNPKFAMRITSRNFRKEKQYLSIIHNLTTRQMRGKLASALLYLSSDKFSDIKIFPELSRQDLANFASIATESAIKFLKEFEKEEIISLEGKDISILDRKKLEHLEKYS